MTQEKIVEMLKAPAKPDLEGIKKYVAGAEDNVFGIDKTTVKHWKEAASIRAAKTMVSHANSPAIRAKHREAFYRSWWGKDSGIDEAMRKAGVEAWQKLLTADNDNRRTEEDVAVLKSMKPEDFQFYISIHLGSRSYRGSASSIYEEEYWRRDGGHWPSGRDTGVCAGFLTDLEKGDKDALKLAEFGYQNVVTCDDYIVFIKLPKQVHLDMIRTRYMLSNPNGLALISASSARKEYAFRGVGINADTEYIYSQRDKEGNWVPGHYKDIVTAKEKFDKFFKDGKLKLTVKQTLNEKNSELRRVFLETFEPEAILNDCDAKLISKESDKDKNINELFSVEIGLPDSWRVGQPGESDPEKSMSRKNRAKMLRYTCPSTGRVYAKFVPFEMVSANEAQAWGHHMTMPEYLNELVAQS